MHTKTFKDFLEAFEVMFPETEVVILLRQEDIYRLLDIRPASPNAFYDVEISYYPEEKVLYLKPGDWISS